MPRCVHMHEHKTVRLCLQLGKEFALPRVTTLDLDGLPLGSARPWVSRSSEGLLVLLRFAQSTDESPSSHFPARTGSALDS